MNTQEAEVLETVNTEGEFHIKMGEAFARLEKDPDFKLIVNEGYLKQKVLDSVSLLAVPSRRNERVNVLEDLVAASNLEYFFMMIMVNYANAMQDASGELDEDFEDDVLNNSSQELIN